MLLQALCIISYPLVILNLSYSPETPNLGHKCDDFFSRVTLKFDGWPWKKKGTSSMLLQALCSISYPLVNSNWSYSPETPNLGQIRCFLEPCDLEIWRMTFKNNRAPLLCYFKLCAAFHSHWWIQTGVTVRKRPIWVKFCDFSAVRPWNLTDDLEKHRAPLLCYFKLCAAFRSHWWIQTGVTVRKRPIWVKFDVF